MSNFAARIPLVRLLIPFIFGIVIAYCFHWSFSISFFLPIVFLGVILLFLQRKFLQRSLKWMGFDGIVIAFCLMLLGAGLTSMQMNQGNTKDETSLAEVHALDAVLINDPVVKEKSVKLFVSVKLLKSESSWIPVNEKMLIYLERSPLAEKLKYGDELLAVASPEQIAGPKNPDEFDYKSWLQRQGVYEQVYSKQTDWKLISQGNGNWFKAIALDLRRFYLNKLQEYGMSGSSFGVAAALLLGASDHLDPGTIQAYSASGTLHVLSVSGMHVALVYVVLLKLLIPLEKKKHGKWLSIFIQLIFLWFYATLTGLCPSVLRSVTMLSVVIAGRAFSRNAHILNSLAASALILLVMNPMLLFDIGFQLSYLAVGGIVTLQPKLESYWEPNTNTFFGKILKHIWTLVSVTLVAQVFTFPLGLFYFQQFPTYFLLSNLIVIPLSTIVMYAGLILLIVSPFVFIAKPIAVLFTFLVHLLNACVLQIEHLPNAVLHSAKWGNGELIFLYAAIIFSLIYLIQYRKGFLQVGLLSIAIMLGFNGCSKWQSLHSRELIFYDINHATGIGVLNGKDFVLLADSTLMKNKGDFDFHIEPFLKAENNNDPEVVSINDSIEFKNVFVHASNNFIKAGGKRIAVIDRNSRILPEVHFDILVLKDNTNQNLEKLLESMKPELVIADGSDGNKKIGNWEIICQQQKVKFYNVKSEGALVIDF